MKLLAKTAGGSTEVQASPSANTYILINASTCCAVHMGIPAKVSREVKSKHGRAQHAPVGTALHYKQCAAQINEGHIFQNKAPA